MLSRRRITINGIVQGIGFRPFVHKLADRFQLSGWILNHSGGVNIEVQGEEGPLEDFLTALHDDAPVLAVYTKYDVSAVNVIEENGFVIKQSEVDETAISLIPPDMAPCEKCLAEMYDEKDRRYRYPFLNCTQCGPRYTIIKSLPYDRPNTTMAQFPMCNDCRAEYSDLADRRYHAQPVACPACGPSVFLTDKSGSKLNCSDPLAEATALLKAGKIIAVKGIGGFHIACDAANAIAVETIRLRKKRKGKPFAIMCRDVAAAKRLAIIGDAEEKILTSPKRPIMLLQKSAAYDLPECVAPGLMEIGIMLCYAPLHYILLEKFDALVMTSANPSSEPLVKDNAAALETLQELVDCFLMHDRPIEIPCDDSVVRCINQQETVIRRGRGYAPFPIMLAKDSGRVLGCGGETKNAICLIRDHYAFLSEHIGDLLNEASNIRFNQTIMHYIECFNTQPDIAACDKHPGYFASRYAAEHYTNPVEVQHHHAHLAAVMVEHGQYEPCIGVALDGTGWGDDAQIWGSEIGIVDMHTFVRKYQFEQLALPGGDAAVREPWRIAAAAMLQSGMAYADVDEFFTDVASNDILILQMMLSKGINIFQSAGAGRYFEAAGAIAAKQLTNTFEGEAAMRLEGMCDRDIKDAYQIFDELQIDAIASDQADITIIPIRKIIMKLQQDIAAKTEPAIAAMRFHNTIIEVLKTCCRILAARTGIKKVVLSGGCMQNRILLEGLLDELAAEKLEVYFGRQVPMNDGGIALGQAVIAFERSKINVSGNTGNNNGN